MGRADDLLIYLIGLVVLTVIVTALLIWTIVSAVKKRDRGATGEPVIDARLEAATASAPGDTPASVETGEKEVLRVLRDMASGAFYIEIEGRAYHNITDIRSPDVSRLVQQVAGDMMRFARNVTPAVATPTVTAPAASGGQIRTGSLSSTQPPDNAAAAPPPAPGSLARRGEALINPPAAPRVSARPGGSGPLSVNDRAGSGTIVPPRDRAKAVRTGPLPALTERLKPPPAGSPPENADKAAPGAATPLSLPSGERVDLGVPSVDSKPKVDTSFWGRALSGSSPATTSAGPRPLADDLEDVLKKILQSMTKTPPFTVHFRTATDGSLSIDIDNVSYPGPDAIPDAAARQFVQIVINKWEAG